MDWFWHTRQRRPDEISRARRSSTGSFSTSSGCTAWAAPKANRSAAIASSEAHRPHSAGTGRPEAAAAFAGARDAHAAIGERQRAAGRHHDGAEPDQQDQRLVIEPHAERAVGLDLAEAHIDLAQAARHDAGFRGRHAARHVEPLHGLDGAELLAAAEDRQGRHVLAVIRLARGTTRSSRAS